MINAPLDPGDPKPSALWTVVAVVAIVGCGGLGVAALIGDDRLKLWAALAWAGVLAVGLTHLLLDNRRWSRRERVRQGRCPTCGYDLMHGRSDLCPECGRRVPYLIQIARQKVGSDE